MSVSAELLYAEEHIQPKKLLFLMGFDADRVRAAIVTQRYSGIWKNN